MRLTPFRSITETIRRMLRRKPAQAITTRNVRRFAALERRAAPAAGCRCDEHPAIISNEGDMRVVQCSACGYAVQTFRHPETPGIKGGQGRAGHEVETCAELLIALLFAAGIGLVVCGIIA